MKSWDRKTAGWVKNANGWWYRSEEGSYPFDKCCVINRHWYLFNKDGYMCTSWHRWNGSRCDPEDGSGDWYYFDPTEGGPLEGACWHSRENGSMEIWEVDLEDKI